MQNTELSDIESSVQTLVRRAYELGRNDVLKRVVDVLKTNHSAGDHPATEHLALAGPQEEAPPAPASPHQAETVAAEPSADLPRDVPWWAWKVR